MHMADALISPAVGGAMAIASAGVASYSIRKVRSELDDTRVPLMGVMGAFVFAAQMINFSIPGTGSSGHLGGGLLLAVLLGPWAGFLTMASVLIIQALFFGDGGLLALGCNVFNLGFYTCFVAFPLIYKRIVGKNPGAGRILAASLLSAVVGLQLGSFSVVMQTLLSGKTELPFGTFLLLMQPIHLAIGIVEGLVTAAVVSFVWKARPELLENAAPSARQTSMSLRKVLAILAIVAVCLGGVLSWFASSDPDGLEWSMERTSGESELEAHGPVYRILAKIQGVTAFLPDYGFKTQEEAADEGTGGEAATGEETGDTSGRAGTSVAGLVGGGLTLALAGVTGVIIQKVKKRKK